jgi:hypothetical protein
MSVKPRTIDNLGIEASIRYAKDKELFEARFLEESRIVPQKAEIPVGKPYAPSEFEQLFSIGKTLSWASFLPPPEYFSYAKPLFSFQLIPSLGSYEKQEADADKLAALEDAIDKQRGSKQDQSDKEKDEEEKERKAIAALLECIHKLDRTLTLINSRRNQYQRG